MKNLLTKISIIVASILVFSCQNYDVAPSEIKDLSEENVLVKSDSFNDTVSSQTLKGARVSASASVSYTTSPSINNWTVSNSSTERLSCGTFTGGLKASVIGIDANKITVRIQQNNNAVFGRVGTAYIKVSSPCGNIAGNTSWTRTDFFYIDVVFWATFESGEVSFIPTIQLNNGVRLHANRISVKAIPSNTFEKILVSVSSYKHFYQLNNPHPNKGMSCVPTSYMIARQIVYPNKTFTNVELNRISIAMGLNRQGVAITSAASFAQKDIGSCNSLVHASTSETTSVNYIKESISANRPLLAVTQLNSNHIVCVVGIKLTGQNKGTIYYIDPLDKTANVRTYDLVSFMKSMRSASCCGFHNQLKVGC